jgi:hypothetical protein
MPTDAAASPRRPLDAFQESIRPAELMIQLYRLLESPEGPISTGTLLDKLRVSCAIADDEDLLLLQNEIFLGLVRQNAPLRASDLRRGSLAHVLRQAIVASCTAYETYLEALLREHLPEVIALRGRDFFPADDEDVVKKFFEALRFEIADVVRLLDDDKTTLGTFIAGKITNFAGKTNLGKASGVVVVGRLLGLLDPWSEIAANLRRSSAEMQEVVGSAIQRRNDIVHRGDRRRSSEAVQEMTFSYASHAVDTLKHVCLAVEEVVGARLAALRSSAKEGADGTR